MGCGTSSGPIELIDMADKCRHPSIQFREEFMRINESKRNIAVWLPSEGVDIKAVVLISHGLGEHALCYYHIAHELVARGYAVYGIDHVSHGKSDGRRGVIASHEMLVNDFIHFVNTTRKQYNHLPAFVLAHSMGTLVALKSLRSLDRISAIALSGPAIFSGHAASSPFGIKSLYPLSQTSFAVGLTAVTSALDPAGPCAPVIIDEITANTAVLADMKKDPRRNDSVVTNKTAKELIQLIRLVKEEIPLINIPIFCIHGEADMIALKKSSEFIIEHVGTSSAEDKHLMIMKNLKHEVFNEPEPYGHECIMHVVNFIENEFNKLLSAKSDTSISSSQSPDSVHPADVKVETEEEPDKPSSLAEIHSSECVVESDSTVLETPEVLTPEIVNPIEIRIDTCNHQTEPRQSPIEEVPTDSITEEVSNVNVQTLDEGKIDGDGTAVVVDVVQPDLHGGDSTDNQSEVVQQTD